MSITFIFYILFFLLNLTTLQYPIFSFFEIENTPYLLLKIIKPEYFWILRIICLFLILIYCFIIFKNTNKNDKNFNLFFILTTPYIFILTKEFLIPPLIFLLVISFFYFYNKTNRIWFMFIFILLTTFIFLNKNILNLSYIGYKILLLKDQLSLIGMFFESEMNSAYLKIPKFGYFYPFLIPVFIFGLINFKHKKNLFYVVLLSFLFYIFSPYNQFIFSAIGFLFVIHIIIIYGLNKIKNKLIFSLIIFLNCFYFLFFIEVYYRHYQKKFSFEREYASINLINLLKTFSNKNIITTKDDKLKKLYEIYSYHYKMPSIEFIEENKLIKDFKKCSDDKIICILDQAIVNNLQLNNNNSPFYTISNADGINQFYLY